MGKFKKMMEHSYLINEIKIKVLSGHLTAKDKKIVKRVTPKQGTLIMFDGETYHSAEQPKKNVRCVVNFDIEKHEY